MGISGQTSDQEAREILLTGARTLVADEPNFIIKTLLTNTGISRAQFRRCFSSKQQLLAALTDSDVQALDGILEAAQPAMMEQSLRAAVGSDIAPSPQNFASQTFAPPAAAPQADAWLERRLRVFERALAGLEKRQEQYEQTLTRHIALVDEKFGALSQDADVRAMMDELQATYTPNPEPEVAMASAPEPQSETHTESFAEAAPEASPLVEAEDIAEQPVAPAPVGEKEMADFVAHARQVANHAAALAAPPPRRRRPPALLAWAGVALSFVILCAIMLFISGAMGHTAGAMPMSAVSHRQVAKTGMARIIAMADNGNANAQTLLALDYLRGQGVATDAAAALRWSRAAAAQGEPLAQYVLGTLEYNSDAGDAVRWFRAAADQGNLKAMHNLAIAYAQGLGAPEDPALAVQWFSRAAGQGYSDSQFDLAVLYERGTGVPQNGATALKWYMIAARQGDAPSAARAAILRDQIAPADVQAATQAAANFVIQNAANAANTAPTL